MKKANNHESAVKALDNLESGLGEKLSAEIQDADAGHYHAALIRIIDRPGQPKNDVRVERQIFNAKGWERIQKGYQASGYSQVILIHTPDQNAVNVPQYETLSVEQKLRAQMQKEFDEKLAAAKKELAEKNQVKTDTAKTDVKILHQDKNYGSEDYVKSLKKSDLIAFIESEKLEVKTDQNAPEILADTLAVLFPKEETKTGSAEAGTPQAIALEVLETGDEDKMTKFVADYGLEVVDGQDVKQTIEAFAKA